MRVLEAIDPQVARSSAGEWNYDRFPYYRRPDWFETSAAPETTARPYSSARDTAVRREAPTVSEYETREQVLARETTAEDESIPRERVRGSRSDEKP
jgi:hypothetical protein